MSFWRTHAFQKNTPPKPGRGNIFGRLLDPIDWLVEAVFAILVLLTFTMAFAFYELNANPNAPVTAEDVNQLLVGILGATIAWGLINGTIYALTSVFERGEKHRVLTDLHNAQGREERLAVIAAELDHILEPITRMDKRQLLYSEILGHLADAQPQPVKLRKADLQGALGCILVALAVVLPALLPLILLRNNYDLAIRLSNLVAFLILFISGYQWGKYSGINPWKIGLLLMLIGVILVMIAIPLGG